MEDIDRKIKEVKLRREQLALERELAIERLKRKIFAGPNAFNRVLARALHLLHTAILAWWKPMTGTALILATALGGYALLEFRDREATSARERIAQELYYKNLNAQMEQTCGKYCGPADGGYMRSFNGGRCEQTTGSYEWCKLEVEVEFKRQQYEANR